MKPAMTTAAFLVALSALGATPRARAIDREMHHGSECKVFGSTAWTDLAFSGYGVKNLQSTARQVICPVTKDSESTWEGAYVAAADMTVYVETGSVDAYVTCTAYVTSNNPAVTGVNTYAHAFGLLPANTAAQSNLSNSYARFASLAGSAFYEDKIYMLCTLGPQVRLKSYYIYEMAATD